MGVGSNVTYFEKMAASELITDILGGTHPNWFPVKTFELKHYNIKLRNTDNKNNRTIRLKVKKYNI